MNRQIRRHPIHPFLSILEVSPLRVIPEDEKEVSTSSKQICKKFHRKIKKEFKI